LVKDPLSGSFHRRVSQRTGFVDDLGRRQRGHRKRVAQPFIDQVCTTHHCDPVARRRWRAFFAVPLLNVAVLAEDAAAAREAVAIIKENDPSLLTPRNRLKRVLAGVPFAGRLLKRFIHSA